MLTITSSLAKKSKKGVSYDFSSVQLVMPPDIAKRCREWGQKYIAPSDLVSDGGTKGREDEMHVTVKFGLHTTSPKEVEKLLSGFGSLTVRLGDVSRFTPRGKEFDVVKIEVLGEKLHQLHHLIGDNVENSDEHSEYRPHMTLAYVKSGECRELSGRDDLKGLKIKIDQVEFSSTNGTKIMVDLN